MTLHTQDDYDRVLARFYGFCDGVIRTVLLQFDESGARSVEVHVATRDSETEKNEGWVRVRIVVRDVSDFGVRERPHTPIQVLSQGIHVLCVANRVGIEFGGAIDRPESFEAFHSSDGVQSTAPSRLRHSIRPMDSQSDEILNFMWKPIDSLVLRRESNLLCGF